MCVSRDDRADWPELRMMTSTGLPASSEPGNSEAREPKGHEVGVMGETFSFGADHSRSSSSSHMRQPSSGDHEFTGWKARPGSLMTDNVR